MSCIVCQSDQSKYKCSICYGPYCSVNCWKDHKNGEKCMKPENNKRADDPTNISDVPKDISFATEDTVPASQLLKLRYNDSLKQLLKNRELQRILTAVDASPNPSSSIQEAMQDPLFVKFVDLCLETVEES